MIRKESDKDALLQRDYRSLSSEDKQYLDEHVPARNAGMSEHGIIVVDDIAEFMKQRGAILLSELDKHLKIQT